MRTVAITQEIQLIQPGKSPIKCDISFAKILASESGLDLILVSNNSFPPLYKIMDSKKYLFQKEKKERNKKTSQKEIRLNLNIGDNDFQTKVRNAYRLIKKGISVKISLLLNREFILKSQMLLLRFSKEIDKIGYVEQLPKDEQQFMTMIIIPRK